MAASFLRSCLITRGNHRSSNQSDLCPLVVPVDCGYLRKWTLLIDVELFKCDLSVSQIKTLSLLPAQIKPKLNLQIRKYVLFQLKVSMMPSLHY